MYVCMYSKYAMMDGLVFVSGEYGLGKAGLCILVFWWEAGGGREGRVMRLRLNVECMYFAASRSRWMYVRM